MQASMKLFQGNYTVNSIPSIVKKRLGSGHPHLVDIHTFHKTEMIHTAEIEAWDLSTGSGHLYSTPRRLFQIIRATEVILSYHFC